MTDRCIRAGRYERPNGGARIAALTVQRDRPPEGAVERGDISGLLWNPPSSATLQASRCHLAVLLATTLHGALLHAH